MFQSYLIVSSDPNSTRAETKKLAKSHKIDIDKASPDVFFVTAKKIEISIDQIRELKSHIYQKPFQHSHKFVVIENAHNATPEAQNSLLKLLEEPPEHAIIVLEAKNKSLLLPTITSRVVSIQAGTSETDTQQDTIIGKDLDSALEDIADIENPQEYLDQQIMSLSQKLIDAAKGKQQLDTNQITQAIEKYKEAKEMIAANVNPAFVLANLVISTNGKF